MSQEIEIEVKSLVTEQAFHHLIQKVNYSVEHAVTQKNHYFETADFILKNKKSALRIREKEGTYTLTLKEPNKKPEQEGLLETHQMLSLNEAEHAINTGELPSGEVCEQLKQLGVNVDSLTYLGTLTTSRIEGEYENGILCFDKSTYLDQVDYEVEFEGSTLSHAHSVIENLLSSANLSQAPTPNKVERFFDRKQQLSS
jgi:uncharacterized protein YjbK